MNKLFNLKAALVAAAMLVLPVAQAATMAKAEYDAGKTRIGADYKADKAACAGQAGNAKDICVEEAKAKERVARAELEYAHTGKSGDRNKVLVAKAESAYAVAKEIGEAKNNAAEDKRDADYKVAIEKCDGLSGDAKANCVAAAKTKFGKN